MPVNNGFTKKQIADINKRYIMELSPCEIVFRHPELAATRLAVKSNFGGKYASIQAVCDAAKKDLREGKGPLHPSALDEIPLYLKELRTERYNWAPDGTVATFFDVMSDTMSTYPEPQGVGYGFMHYYRHKLLTAGGLPEPLIKLPCRRVNFDYQFDDEKMRAVYDEQATFCVACLRRLKATARVSYHFWQGYMWVYGVHHHTCETFMADLFRKYAERSQEIVRTVKELQTNIRLQARRLRTNAK